MVGDCHAGPNIKFVLEFAQGGLSHSVPLVDHRSQKVLFELLLSYLAHSGLFSLVEHGIDEGQVARVLLRLGLLGALEFYVLGGVAVIGDLFPEVVFDSAYLELYSSKTLEIYVLLMMASSLMTDLL